MKFNTPCTLYYVCPYTFIIEKLKIDMAVNELDKLFYIDDSGAYLPEHDLFDNLKDAKYEAFKRLEKFYLEKTIEITHANPKYQEWNPYGNR